MKFVKGGVRMVKWQLLTHLSLEAENWTQGFSNFFLILLLIVKNVAMPGKGARRQNSDWRACLKADQTMVRGLLSSSRLSVTGFY